MSIEVVNSNLNNLNINNDNINNSTNNSTNNTPNNNINFGNNLEATQDIHIHHVRNQTSQAVPEEI